MEIHNHELDIEDPDWLDSFFFFYDENLKLVRIKVLDVLDITKLGYSYEPVDRPWLNKRPTPSVPPELARQILKNREKQRKLKLSINFGPHGRALDSSLTVEVDRSKRKTKAAGEEEVLVVHGIEVKGDEYVKFDVFVNLVDESRISPKFIEFAGTFASIPGGGVMMKKVNLKLGISELLRDMKADEDESIWVTLLPKTTSCSNLTVGGVRIEYIK